MTPAASLQQLRDRYAALQVREQRALQLCAAVVLGTLIYVGLWEPLVGGARARGEALRAQRALAVEIETLAVRARTQPRGAPRIEGGPSLLSAIDTAARSGTLGKPLTRIQPDGDTKVRVWLDDIAFDNVMRWLNELQQRGVQIGSADFDAKGNGLVSVRLTLERGP